MKSRSQLTDFYYTRLYPALQDLEKKRKDLLYRIFVAIILLSLVFVVIIYSLSLFQTTELLIFSLFVFVAMGSIFYKFLTKEYILEFKQNIMKPLINAISTDLIYSSNRHISEYIFNRSDLFRRADRVSGDDYVEGLIKATKIEFSDLHAQVRQKDSRGKKSWSTLFRGLFIVAEFHKEFSSKTIVLPDRAQSAFGDLIGGWLQSNNFARDELVKMDSSEFEREFVVYSSNQIEARYILSHSLMKRILDLLHRAKHPLYISFIGNNIHIAIDYKKNLFEPSIFHSLLEYKIAMEYIETLHLALSIIDELNLDKKLWSKL